MPFQSLYNDCTYGPVSRLFDSSLLNAATEAGYSGELHKESADGFIVNQQFERIKGTEDSSLTLRATASPYHSQ